MIRLSPPSLQCCCAPFGRDVGRNAVHPSEPYHTLSGILAWYLISQISLRAFHLIHNSPVGELAKNSVHFGCLWQQRREMTRWGYEMGTVHGYGRAVYCSLYKDSPQVMFPHFLIEERRARADLSSSPPSFLSHCVAPWRCHSGNKQLGRYRWVKIVSSIATLFCPSPRHSVTSAKSISCKHTRLQDVTFVNPGVCKRIVWVYLIRSQACNNETGRDSLVPQGAVLFLSAQTVPFRSEDVDVSYY